MRNPEYFIDKKVTVVGLARSGVACANLLYTLGARVRVSDHADTPAVRNAAARLSSKDIEVERGGHDEQRIKGSELLVLSPGVPAQSKPVRWAAEAGIPVLSEIEIGWMLCPATVIAVTGSTGKSTVATLIGRVLEASGRRAFVCGNIGTPFCAEVARMEEGDFVSLEVSSFQLECIRTFTPKIALILNISRNHLDRHRDMQEYVQAKARIFMNQGPEDFLVLNAHEELLKGLDRGPRSRVVFFSESDRYNPNQAAVVEVALLLGIEEALCRKVFAEFKGLPHRAEFVDEIQGVRFINDSKATVAESAAWAIRNIPSRLVLIAGGRDKGVDYRMILEAARAKVKEVVLIGEARGLIRQALEKDLPVSDAATLEDAVRRAFALASPGEYVLLSPMCSSFDMFRDYEHRGESFRQAVSALKRSVR